MFSLVSRNVFLGTAISFSLEVGAIITLPPVALAAKVSVVEEDWGPTCVFDVVGGGGSFQIITERGKQNFVLLINPYKDTYGPAPRVAINLGALGEILVDGQQGEYFDALYIPVPSSTVTKMLKSAVWDIEIDGRHRLTAKTGTTKKLSKRFMDCASAR